MVNDCSKRCHAKNVFAGKRNFSLNKAKKEKKTFLWKVWINADVSKYAKRQEMFPVMTLCLSDHTAVLHSIASSSSFFRFRSDFLAFFARISKFLEIKDNYSIRACWI